MGSPADYTIIVMLVGVAVTLWGVWDRIGQVQRDVDAIKRKVGVIDPPGERS